jgi:hypothetical protein
MRKWLFDYYNYYNNKKGYGKLFLVLPSLEIGWSETSFTITLAWLLYRILTDTNNYGKDLRRPN